MRQYFQIWDKARIVDVAGTVHKGVLVKKTHVKWINLLP